MWEHRSDGSGCLERSLGYRPGFGFDQEPHRPMRAEQGIVHHCCANYRRCKILGDYEEIDGSLLAGGLVGSEDNPPYHFQPSSVLKLLGCRVKVSRKDPGSFEGLEDDSRALQPVEVLLMLQAQRAVEIPAGQVKATFEHSSNMSHQESPFYIFW